MSWGLVAVAGAAVVTSAVGANSARSAARAQGRGADAATNESARQYDQTRRDLAPYRNIGAGALNLLGQPYGLSTGGPSGGGGNWDDSNLFGDAGGVPMVDSDRYANDPAYRYAWDRTLETEKANRPGWRGQETYWARATNEDWSRLNETMARNLGDYRAQHPQQQAQPGQPGATGDFSNFIKSPDYQFRRDEGMRGTERSAASRGGAFSGNALRALAEFNSNLASTEYGNYFNRLSSLAGIGQSATNTTAAYGAQHAQNAGRNALAAGDARASGIIGQGNAIGQGVSDLAGAYGYYSANRNRVAPGYGGTGYGSGPYSTPGYGDMWNRGGYG
jgi:hypothetical protein